MSFNFKRQKWADLVSGNFVNWALSVDSKFFYLTTGGADPMVQRVRLSDRKAETITSLKNLRRVVDPVDYNTQISVAPDGSPVFTRDNLRFLGGLRFLSGSLIMAEPHQRNRSVATHLSANGSLIPQYFSERHAVSAGWHPLRAEPTTSGFTEVSRW